MSGIAHFKPFGKGPCNYLAEGSCNKCGWIQTLDGAPQKIVTLYGEVPLLKGVDVKLSDRLKTHVAVNREDTLRAYFTSGDAQPPKHWLILKQLLTEPMFGTQKERIQEAMDSMFDMEVSSERTIEELQGKLVELQKRLEDMNYDFVEYELYGQLVGK